METYLKAKRRLFGLTQLDLAELLSVSRNTIIEIERDENAMKRMRYDKLEDLASIFDMTLHSFMQEMEDYNNNKIDRMVGVV